MSSRARDFHRPWWRRFLARIVAAFAACLNGYGEMIAANGYEDVFGEHAGWMDQGWG